MNMTYEEYLFTQIFHSLLSEIDEHDMKSADYDVVYTYITDKYTEFCESNYYREDSMSLYQAIDEWLSENI